MISGSRDERMPPGIVCAEPLPTNLPFEYTIATTSYTATMDLSKPQDNPYEEEVRQQRLKVQAAKERLIPQSVIDALKPQHTPRPEKRTKRSAPQPPAQPPRRSERNKYKSVVYADLEPLPMATEANTADAGANTAPPDPLSALVAVLAAKCSDWESPDDVRSVAEQLRKHKITAGQIEKRVITEKDLEDMGFAIGDRKRILPPPE